MCKLWHFGFFLLVTGCGLISRSEQDPVRNDPAAGFNALEYRLLQADQVQLTFEVAAQGVIAADLRGKMKITPAGAIELTANGHFAGKPVALQLRTEGENYLFRNNEKQITSPRPDHLKEALLVGLTRMGILHNLARLTHIMPPDYAAGGVREWVKVEAFSVAISASNAMAFDLIVAGERAGAAMLEVDAHGHPTVRRQTVQFPTGQMQVVERYSLITIEP